MQVIPILIGTLFLVSWLQAVLSKDIFYRVFSGNTILDSLAGALFGSISGGSPITSYIIGGELLQQGVSLTAVTAFILTWVTVGVIQLPAELLILGKKFAIARNIVSFVSALMVAIFITLTLAFI
ncbi:MAG: hypothetical protein KAR00_01205 [Candidatus Pacebacteria bacterium]|nr:hypothetical protein [Candidatus Paceibacterota bacterium]